MHCMQLLRVLDHDFRSWYDSVEFATRIAIRHLLREIELLRRNKPPAIPAWPSSLSDLVPRPWKSRVVATN